MKKANRSLKKLSTFILRNYRKVFLPGQRNQETSRKYNQRTGQANPFMLFFEKVTSHEHAKNDTGLS